MNIVFKCEFCRAEMQAAEDSVGKQCICVACGKRTTIGKSASTPSSGPASSSAQQLLSVECPQCRQNLDYARSLIGTKGLCRNCHSMLVLPADGQPASILRRPQSHIAFECPTCLQLFEGSRAQVGQKGRCTNCESVFIITPLEPKETKVINDTPAVSAKRNVAAPARPASTTPQRSPDLELAPDSQSEATPRPKRPVPTLKSQPSVKNKPQTAAPSSLPTPTPAPQPATNVPWPDLGDLSQSVGFPATSNPYTSSNIAYTGSRSLSISTLFSNSMNRLFPAGIYISVAMLGVMVAPILGIAALALIGYLLTFLPELPPLGRYILGILGIIALVAVTIASWIYFFPPLFSMAIRAAKGKDVNFESLNISSHKRLSIVGFWIVQYFLLLPLMFIGALPIMIVSLIGANDSLILAILTSMFFSFFSYLQSTILSIGACAVADDQSVGSAISISFSRAFRYAGILLPLLALELIPMVFLSTTVLGMIFLGAPYVLIRSAVFYQLTK